MTSDQEIRWFSRLVAMIARDWANEPPDDDYDDPEAAFGDGPPWYGENAKYAAKLMRQTCDSGRRLALFRKAETALQVAARLRGCDDRPYPYYARNGRRLGLYVMLDRDHEMHWSPRGGYRIVDVDNLPF